MGARPARERRPAVWPWLVMPLIVLLVFCALTRVHHHNRSSQAARPAAGATQAPAPPAPRQQ